MSETKFTPGPWRVLPDPGTMCEVCGEDSFEYGMVCTAEGPKAGIAIILHDLKEEANAHLIAAAPEMYEALCDMVSDRDYLSDATVEYAQRILAKARGEVT